MRLFSKLVIDKNKGPLTQNFIKRLLNLDSSGFNLRKNYKMTPQEKFLFDLNGFIVVRNVLNDTEVLNMNTAIDDHIDAATPR